MDKRTSQKIQNDIHKIKEDMAEIKTILQLVNNQLFHRLRDYNKINASLRFFEEQFIRTLTQVKALIEDLKTKYKIILPSGSLFSIILSPLVRQIRKKAGLSSNHNPYSFKHIH